jgi:polyhydroxyalkanoate synthesis regulator phasin
VPSAREQYLQALVSLSDLTRTQAERVAALLAKQGEVQSAQVNRVTEDLMRRTQKNREILTRLVQREVKRQLGVLGMASRDEVARLQQRVRALEQEVERSAKAAPARPSASASESSSAAAKPAARTRAASSGSAAKPATRAKPGSSGTAAKSSTRSRSAASAGSAKPATRTRTRTGGTSSRSAASSPGTRRRGGAKGSPGSGSGTSDTGSGSGG